MNIFLKTKTFQNAPHVHSKCFTSRFKNVLGTISRFISRKYTKSVLNAIANRFVSGIRRSRYSKRSPSVNYLRHRALTRCEVWVGYCWCLPCMRSFLHRCVISKRILQQSAVFPQQSVRGDCTDFFSAHCYKSCLRSASGFNVENVSNISLQKRRKGAWWNVFPVKGVVS